jgi:hypothetical protein
LNPPNVLIGQKFWNKILYFSFKDFQQALKLKLELEALIKEHKTLHDDVLRAKDITVNSSEVRLKKQILF